MLLTCSRLIFFTVLLARDYLIQKLHEFEVAYHIDDGECILLHTYIAMYIPYR